MFNEHIFILFFLSFFDTTLSKTLIEDCCCNFEKVDSQIHSDFNSLIDQLCSQTFFKIFKVNLNKECPFWPSNFQCTNRDCSCTYDECDVPPSWQDTDPPIDHNLGPNPFTHWNERDDSWIVQDFLDSDSSYINLELNLDGYTGYKGSEPAKIWKAIYMENCFHTENIDEMCFEERVFWRLINGMDASISANIIRRYPISESESGNVLEYGPSYKMYQLLMEKKPLKINNLYFVFVFLLRALNKAKDTLVQYPISTGNPIEENSTRILLEKVLSSPLIVECTASESFNDVIMFQKEDNNLKQQFKSHFRNISRIMDCVGCEKCRLHGKLQTLGIGTALKILFDTNPIILDHNEVIALINTVKKFSDATKTIFQMRSIENTNSLFWRISICACVIFIIFTFIIITRKYKKKINPIKKQL